MNVLLTTSAAPQQSPFSTTEKRPPLGLGFLISVLREAGHKVFFIDNYLSPSNFLETDYLERHDIDIVGIYANTICFRDTRRMLHKLEYLRQTGRWRGKIIVGGPHTSVALETIPPFVDFVVQGEGERAILDIVEGRAAERVLRCRRIDNLDELPMPAWDYFIHQPYNWGGDWFPGTPVFTMNTSRGCPFHCTFCSVGSIWGKKYTCFSAERIVADIDYLMKQYGAQGIYFREDNFTVNRERTEKFCQLLLNRNIKITWACETRVDTLDRELVGLMQQAGLAALYFGVESGSQDVLNRLQKKITPEQTRAAFGWCQEFGIKTAASVIVGTPGETPQDLQQTLALINDLKPAVTWFNVFVGIPQSPLYQQALDEHLYEFIDDRGLVYLKGHNDRVKTFYGGQWDASIPITKNAEGEINAPQISIVMSVFNGAPHLEEAFTSILQQTYANFELIVVNDAFADATSEILQEFDDCRIRVINNPRNLGLTKSLNIGMSAARGKYIARMDADDLALPHRLELQWQFLENHPDYALVGSPYYQIDEQGQIHSLIRVLTEDAELRAGLKQQNWFGHGSVMMRREAVEQLGGYDERFIYAQDYDLWLRMSEHFHIANLEEPLYCWRASASSISQSRIKEQEYFADLARKYAIERENTSNICCQSEEVSISPMVSVIVPAYNRPEMLVLSIQSILDQTYKDYEIIVVNDCGLEVESIVAWLNQQQNITYVRHGRNRGLAAARNTGIKMARGKYLAYLDDDDIFYPDHLETLVTFLETSHYRVAYTDALRAVQVKKHGRYATVERDLLYPHDFNADRLMVANEFPVLCVMHERACLDQAGVFDESLTTHEDWDLWIRLSLQDNFAHIKKITCEFSWREDGSTMSSAKRLDFVRTMEIIHAKYQQHLRDKPHIRTLQRQFWQEQKAVLGCAGSGAEEAGFKPNDLLAKATIALPVSGSERVPASIIIPVFNNLELTQNCLESIWEHTPPELYEIIVVDNGSSDGTPTFLKHLATAGKIRPIANETNLGYAKACNQAARSARGDNLIMLNNDTVVTDGWLNALIETVEKDDNLAIVGAKLIYPNDSVQHAGVVFNQKGKVYHLYRYFHRDHPAVNKTREFQVVTAACLLIRTSVFFQVGLFDEGFVNGFEDVDLCLRVGQAGYGIVYNPDCVVYHLESMTSGRSDHDLNNSRYLMEKWQGRPMIPDDFKYYEEDGLRLEWITNSKGEREAVIHDQNDNPYKHEARTCLNQGDLPQAMAFHNLALRFNPFDPRNRALIAEMETLKEMAEPRSQAVHA
jgi:GT2 family glycosyltransferase/radical SAM superfamily enzyme YgiQ (UPF0313 family)